MSDPAANARTVALAMCAGAVVMVVIAALAFTGTLDLGLDGSTRTLLAGALTLAAVMDVVMAWVLYQKLSTKK